MLERRAGAGESRHAHQAVELIKAVGAVLHMKLVSERDIGLTHGHHGQDLRITVHGFVIHLRSPKTWFVADRDFDGYDFSPCRVGDRVARRSVCA